MQALKQPLFCYQKSYFSLMAFSSFSFATFAFAAFAFAAFSFAAFFALATFAASGALLVFLAFFAAASAAFAFTAFASARAMALILRASFHLLRVLDDEDAAAFVRGLFRFQSGLFGGARRRAAFAFFGS